MNEKLLKAVRSGKLEDMIQLLEEEANLIDSVTPNENNVMHVAARLGYTNIVEYLIQNYPALISKINHKGETPLHLAAMEGHRHVVGAFMTQVTNSIDLARVKNNRDNTPLHVAVKNGRYLVVFLLVDRYPELLMIQNLDGETPRSIALNLRWNHISAKMINLRHDTLQYKTVDGQTTLHLAVMGGDLDSMNLILQIKNDLANEQDIRKRTALHYAAALGNYKMVKALIEKNISTAYIPDENDQIPLHLAAKSGKKNVLKLLLDNSGDTTEIKDNKKQTILHVAADNGNLHIVSYILKLPEMEDLVNSRDKDGNTPLHLAAKKFHYNVVSALSMNLRVLVRVTNNSNQTALAACLAADDNGMDFQKHLTFKALKSSYQIRGISRQDISEFHGYKIKADSRSRQMAQTISVMATLMATFTFTAVFTLPGGVTPNVGTALMIHKRAFQAFIISDTIAMTTSITAAVIVFWSSSWCDNEAFMDTLPFAIGLTWVAMIAMTLAFVNGLFVVLGNVLWLAILVCTIGCLAPVFLYIFAPMFLILYDNFCSSHTFLHHRGNIVWDNPFHFVFRLFKMMF